jgi:predicted NBD/HSP70 family sugar kinase
MATPRSRAETRWHSVSQVLAHVRRHPGITRAALARELELTSGFATELVARMRRARLLDETPAPISGRGRPTTSLRPHPDGPLVLAIELRQDGWRDAIVSVDGELHDARLHRHRDREPSTALMAMRRAVDQARDRYGHRLRAVALAVAGIVRDEHLVQASTLGWGPLDLTTLTRPAGLPLLVGNDATLAGVAEARTGAAACAHSALHLIVTTGIGGVLTVDGHPVDGAHGAAGEYGHLPLGDRRLRCPCGARGCWDLEVDGRAIARHLGEPAPADPRAYALRVLEVADTSSPARDALAAVAQALAAGIAGLVNACDPDLVTLGGLGAPIRRAAGTAFDQTYTDGLMTFRRSQPPPIIDATHGDDGPLHGAAIVGLDHITSGAALAEWSTTAH